MEEIPKILFMGYKNPQKEDSFGQVVYFLKVELKPRNRLNFIFLIKF